VTTPRFIIKGQLVFVTARCVARTFRFTPTKAIRELLIYCLAAILDKYKGRIQLHEFEFMSNHYHFLLTDVDACLPQFMCDLNSLIGRSLNAERGIKGTCIEKGYNIVAPRDDAKVVKHAVYTLANACAAHLVRRTKDWLGPSSFRYSYGESVTVERPQAGLWAEPGKAKRRRKPSKFPKEVELELVRPPVCRHLSDAQLRKHILESVEACESQAQRERKKNGRSVIGMAEILKQGWWECPKSRETTHGTEPTVSASSKWLRIEALKQRKAFLEAYRDAWNRYRAGEENVVFPYGTWKMRVLHNMRCAGPPA
jgi:REP element-mobilizing transposase RayT